MKRPVVERTFSADDGARLAFRHWPAQREPRGAVVLLHRGHEHGGRLAHLPDELDLPDFSFYAPDLRGHGRSLSPVPPGESALLRFSTFVDDLDAFVRHLRTADGLPVDALAVVGQSLGAVLAAGWVHAHAPRLRALVLAAPAFSIRLYVPLARAGLRLLRAAFGPFRVTSFVRPWMLTHDAERIASFDEDPLVTLPIEVDLLLDVFDAGDRLVADARAIGVPTQVLISGADAVVYAEPQHTFYVRLGSAVRERAVFPGLFHDTLGERDRGPVLARVRAFLLARFAEPVNIPSRRHADALGHTRDEYEALQTPLSPLTLRGLGWSAVRMAWRVGESLSDGMALGRRVGYDAGAMLDYVYRDRAGGRGPLGRWIDRIYLDSPGWAGIRERKRHVEGLLVAAGALLRAANRKVIVVDLASGHGRYVLDALEGLDPFPERIVLRDIDPANLEAARGLAGERGIAGLVHVEPGDALDPRPFAADEDPPTVAIVSGLYELVPDNASVARSLDGIARMLAPGGYLVVTCQPWHPQLELIARTLRSRTGAPWVMRRRTQAEVDELLAGAGFVKVRQRTSRGGIFTVTLARRG